MLARPWIGNVRKLGVEARLDGGHAQKLAEPQVGVESVAKRLLAAHRVRLISSEAFNSSSGGIDGRSISAYMADEAVGELSN